MELPATDVPPDRLCLWVGLDATLRGDPDDPDVAWLAYPGGRVEVVWPPGYRARFAPRLEILDPRGRVVLREGQRISQACATVDPDQVLLIPSP